MPYLIHRPSKRQRALAVASVGLLTWLGAAGLAATPAMADTASCSDPVLTQPFTASNDQNYYTLVPVRAPTTLTRAVGHLPAGRRFSPQRWPMAAVAVCSILPSGSMAVSPPVCVNSNYPTARTMLGDVAGRGGVLFYASYASPNTGTDQNNSAGGQNQGQGAGWFQGSSQAVGWLQGAAQGGGWSLSDPLQLNPPKVSAWTIARLRFISLGTENSDYQLYDFYVDPYSRGCTRTSQPAAEDERAQLAAEVAGRVREMVESARVVMI